MNLSSVFSQGIKGHLLSHEIFGGLLGIMCALRNRTDELEETHQRLEKEAMNKTGADKRESNEKALGAPTQE